VVDAKWARIGHDRCRPSVGLDRVDQDEPSAADFAPVAVGDVSVLPGEGAAASDLFAAVSVSWVVKAQSSAFGRDRKSDELADEEDRL
jgi:hypothetical protein